MKTRLTNKDYFMNFILSPLKVCFVSISLAIFCAPSAVKSQPDISEAEKMEMQKKAEDLVEKADSLCLTDEEDIAATVKLYKSALGIYRRLKRADGEGWALQNLGRCYERRERFQEFAETFEQLLPFLPSSPPEPRAKLLRDIGIAYLKPPRAPEKALKFLVESAALWKRTADEKSYADSLVLVGGTQALLDNEAETKSNYLAAARIFQARADFYDEADAYMCLGQFLSAHQERLFYLRAALERWRQLKTDPAPHTVKDITIREADALEALGITYLSADESLSLYYYREAVVVWNKLGMADREAGALSYIVLLQMNSNNEQKALENYNKAKTIWRAKNNPAAEADLLTKMGWAYGSNQEFAQAAEKFKEAARLWSQIPGSREAVICLSEAALAAARLDKREEALETVAKVASELDKAAPEKYSNDRLFVLGNIALTHFFAKDYETSINYLNQLIKLNRETGNRKEESANLFFIGWNYELQGKKEEALKFYLDSIQLKEQLRSEIRIGEFKRSAFNADAGVYQRAVLNLMELGRKTEAFELSERARARAFLDQVGNLRLNPRAGADGELIRQEQKLRDMIGQTEQALRRAKVKPLLTASDNEQINALEQKVNALYLQYRSLVDNLEASQPEYASLLTVKTLKLNEIQKKLPDEKSILLSYYVMPEKVLVFIIGQKEFQAVDLCPAPGEQCVNQDKLKALVNSSVGLRDFGDLQKGHPESLQRLYNWLIKPIRPQLKNESKIGVIPNGALNYVPFAALSDGKRYLVQDFYLYQLPSASIIPFLEKKRKPAGNTLLSMVNSRPESLPALKVAKQTAREVAELYKTTFYPDEKATETFFAANAGKADTVFVSGHGFYNPRNPLFSNFTLAKDADGKNDGILNLFEIYDLNLEATNLVVLNGCETQLGQLTAGDEVIALNRGFIYAGAPSVVASLWSVDETPTQALMKNFFTHLKQSNGNKVESLRLAQMDVMKQFPNPFYWAAFSLSGLP
jgi:CHAT domain-containing protein